MRHRGGLSRQVLIALLVLSLGMLLAPSLYDNRTQAQDNYPVQIDVVVGTDDRQQIADTSAWPYRAISYLRMTKGTGAWACTGTFIGPDVLITAAHCLWGQDKGGYMDSVRVVPARNGSVEPYGRENAANIWVPQGWIASAGGDSSFDYALVIMESGALGSAVGNFSLYVMTTESLSASNFNPTVAGYPGDKPSGTMWSHTYSSFRSVSSTKLTYTVDTYGGESGSAVWPASSTMIVGVHNSGSSSGGVPVYNNGRRIDQQALNDMLGACQQYGCSISYAIEGAPEPPTATPSPSPSPTPSPVPTSTPTPTRTSTPAPTPTRTPVPPPTSTPVPLPTATPVAEPTYVPVSTATATPVSVPTINPLPGSAGTPVPVPTSTPTPTRTSTPVSAPGTTPAPAQTNTPNPVTGTPTPTPGTGPAAPGSARPNQLPRSFVPLLTRFFYTGW